MLPYRRSDKLYGNNLAISHSDCVIDDWGCRLRELVNSWVRLYSIRTGRPVAGSDGHKILQEHLLFISKATADTRFNHTDVFHRQTDQRRDHPANVKWHLGAGAHYQPVIFIPICDTDMWFEVRVLLLGSAKDSPQRHGHFWQMRLQRSRLRLQYGGQCFAQPGRSPEYLFHRG